MVWVFKARNLKHAWGGLSKVEIFGDIKRKKKKQSVFWRFVGRLALAEGDLFGLL
jgi:hypothetical protein